ncbi:hypothetical protein [Actinomyces naeslundii]|uniref:hypothetical protein n=1 Tax=Actinomyces naeslundii TaxID=1655 RepID=UPI000AB0E72B|nr:hypothetical protein [Actinomyces naeslundii]
MTATLSAARSFTSEPYFSAAQELDSQGRLISQAAEDVSNVRASVVDNWQGEAATAFAAKTKSVEDSGQQLSKNLNSHAQLLSWYAGAKSKACKSAVAVAESAKAKGFDVSDAWKVSLSLRQLVGNDVGLQVFEMAIFQLVIDTHVSLIEQVDSQAIIALGGNGKLTASSSGAPTNNSTAPHVTSNGYTVGKVPERQFNFDNDFPFGSKKGQDTWSDHKSWWKWEAMLRGAQTLRPDLDDALPMYEHYRDKSGTSMTFDFEEGYKEDAGIRREVNGEMSRTLTAANELVKEGHTSIDFHSGVKESGKNNYPETENWQKTVGGYSYYSDSQLKVDGDTVTLTTTMTAKDRWNFDRKKQDMGTGVPDSENGRFEELGWAKSFETSGTVTRTYTWKVGEEPPIVDDNTNDGPGGTRNESDTGDERGTRGEGGEGGMR